MPSKKGTDSVGWGGARESVSRWHPQSSLNFTKLVVKPRHGKGQAVAKVLQPENNTSKDESSQSTFNVPDTLLFYWCLVLVPRL